MRSPRRLRRLAMTLFLCILSFSLVGCAGVKKKFIRQPRERPVQPVTYTEERFVKPYSNKYYYTTRFNYWKTWHDELIASLGKNQKRQNRSIDELLSQLEQMQKHLIEPKKSELGAEIDAIKSTTQNIDSIMGSQASVLKPKLEKSRRIINANFNYEAVKDFVEKDKLTMDAAPPAPPAP